MPRYKSCIQQEWLEDKRWKRWLRRVDGDDTVLRCDLCNRSFDVVEEGGKDYGRIKAGNNLQNRKEEEGPRIHVKCYTI